MFQLRITDYEFLLPLCSGQVYLGRLVFFVVVDVPRYFTLYGNVLPVHDLPEPVREVLWGGGDGAYADAVPSDG